MHIETGSRRGLGAGGLYVGKLALVGAAGFFGGWNTLEPVVDGDPDADFSVVGSMENENL